MHTKQQPRASARGGSAASAKNAISASGELLLYGIIGDWWDDLDALGVVRQLERMDGDEIRVRIHSDGGYITEGLAIYNALKGSSKRVHVTIDGIAASMASVVAMAGDTVVMPSNSFLMIHKPWNRVAGDAEELRRNADVLDQFEESLIGSYHARTGIAEDQIKAMLAAETWISASEAVDMGFADSITDPLQAAAQLDLSGFGNVPTAAAQLLSTTPTPPAPANPAAQAATPQQNLEGVMPQAKKPDDAPANPQAQENETPQASAADAVAAVEQERRRVAGIRALGKTHRLTDDEVGSMIDDGTDEAQARSKVLDILASRDEQTMPRGHISVVGHDSEALREGMKAAIMHRVNPAQNALPDAAREFRGMSLIDMGRMVIEVGGGTARGMTPMEVAAKALSTSDFPAILADVANETLREGYEAAPRTFMPFCRETEASDFKNINRAQLGEAPELEKVNESGEFKYGKMGEDNAQYRLETFGKIIPLTRQTIINDDLDAFSRVPTAFGSAAAELESNIVWGLITENVKMSDNKALFHADHGNLGTAGALDITTLTEARKKMRRQKGLNTSRPLNLMAQYLIVPAALETKGQQIISEILSAKSADVNPFAGTLQLIVEPRLDEKSETAWYLAAAPSRIDTIEYAYLSGERGVYIETQQGFDVDGVKIKARLDFGAGAIDYRGLFKNAGA